MMRPSLLPALLLLSLALAGCTPSPQPPTPNTAPTSAGQPSAARRSRDTLPRAASTFDFFLLNLSWSPEFCQTHASAAECAQHDTFVLHGLWPENADGTYPSNCSTAPGPQDPSQYTDVYPDPGLLQHEWQTHGTCSGLAPDAYFQTARQAFHSVAIPPTLAQLTSQISLPPGGIQTLFTTANPSLPASSLIVSCGNNNLTAVEVCLDKSLHPTACGPAIRSCHANTVRIPAP